MAAKSLKKEVKKAARLGEGRDKIMAHLSPGEVVLPISFQEKFPAVGEALRQAFKKSGLDYEQFVAGSSSNKINSRTGAPMFWDGGDDGGGGWGSDDGDGGYGDASSGEGGSADDGGGGFGGYGGGYGDDGGTGNAASGEGGSADEGGGGFGGYGGGYGDDFGGDIGGLETGFDASDDPNDSINADPNIELNVEDFEPTIDPALGPDVSPGQMAFDSFMNNLVDNVSPFVSDVFNSFLAGRQSQATTAGDVRGGNVFSDSDKAAIAAELAAAPTVDPTVDPTVAVDPTSERDADRAALTSYVTSSDIINNAYGLTAPSSDPSFLGPAYAGPTGPMVGPATSDAAPETIVNTQDRADAIFDSILGYDKAATAPGPYGNLNLNYAGPTLGYVGTTFDGRLAGDERAEAAPAVAGPSYTEADIAGRTGNLTGLGKGAVSPGYDISTYITDPYETISGAVQQGDTTPGVDGTPDGGGENVRRPLTEEEVQYLADMGYMNEGGGASTPTVRPAVAPIKYDISKFVSGIGSLATSNNKT